ncbi:flagellar hook-basal body protein [Desulfofundulus sp.]|uniref:flagellar hook-basal body protein n=1 Tax=Desulfofundulus sp. TaxID=2282750 RepID=UPI003C736CF4
MIRGIYTAASGLGVQQARLDVLANNLANASTSGFKADGVIQKPFPQLLLVEQQNLGPVEIGPRWRYVGATNQGAAVTGVVTNFSPGPLKPTGKNTHLALATANTFLVVQTPGGERYTRDGNLGIDSEGYLVDSRGNRVLGEAGPVQVKSDDFRITDGGEIILPGKGPAGRLRIVQFADLNLLTKTEDNYYTAPAGSAQPAAKPEVRQGYLEGSNVDPAASMVQLVSAVRSYEANQRLLQAQDQLLDLAVNRVGALR